MVGYKRVNSLGDLQGEMANSARHITEVEKPNEGVRSLEFPVDVFDVATRTGKTESPFALRCEVDKDFLCPICMQTIKDAFVTACGHSFCYMCILTHLESKSDCPCCCNHLTTSLIFPNFLLSKVMKKASANQHMRNMSVVEQFHYATEKGCELNVKEIVTLLELLSEKKIKIEQEEAERNMQVLMDFLYFLRKLKTDKLTEIQSDLRNIKADINSVERYKMGLTRSKEKYLGESVTRRNFQHSNAYVKAGVTSHDDLKTISLCDLNGQSINPSSLAAAKKRRIHAQFNDLQECYLEKRRQLLNRSSPDDPSNGAYNVGLADFQSVLSTFSKYSRLSVFAEFRQGDIFQSANIISSIEFDCENVLFATAGVSCRIKVYDFSATVREDTNGGVLPVAEMGGKSKLSCLSWNKQTKCEMASSDYDGVIALWDVNSCRCVMEYEEHEKRAWSVDFSSVNPSMLLSGSDDCKVKVWCTKEERSVMNIDMKANICCVKYNPGSNSHIAVGSADHQVHYFDLRNAGRPLHVFSGHCKAVSYVKFMSDTELASASTDSTLRLWDVQRCNPVRSFRGHTNEKNFVGLSVNKEYMACGSETNQVFVYHKELSRPFASHMFSSDSAADEQGGGGGGGSSSLYFTSASCWRDTCTLLAANSRGIIKVLSLAR